MARVTLSVPDELLDLIRESLPQLNISATLQDALRARLSCSHKVLACASCAASMEASEVIDEALSRFYGDALWDLGETRPHRRDGGGIRPRPEKRGRAPWRHEGDRHSPAPRHAIPAAGLDQSRTTKGAWMSGRPWKPRALGAICVGCGQRPARPHCQNRYLATLFCSERCRKRFHQRRARHQLFERGGRLA